MELKEIENIVKKKIEAAGDAAALLAVRVEFLGRKGTMVGLFSELAELKGGARKNAGQELNTLKQYIMTALQQKEDGLQAATMGKLAEAEKLDVTLPGTRPPLGHLHITTAAIEEITKIFERIGFQRVRYPEVDFDWYAFEGLNMPKSHPARDEWETFFVDAPVHQQWGKMVLTPHSTNGDVHELLKKKLPVRTINITKCYRRQSDISHVPMFHQFDGLYVDREASVTNLKGVLEYFVRAFFGPERKVRLRPFHFRFTEPSFEMDVSCGVCGGTGRIKNAELRMQNGQSEEKCRLCKAGWLELGGSGMLHPNVLKLAGLDPKEWKGFAFGWGVERNYMMKAGLKIDDIRVMYNNDLSFAEQF